MKKEIKIEKDTFGKQYAGKYIFQSISWGRSNEITSQCTSINPMTKMSKVDLRKLQALLLDATMIERPSIVTVDKLMSENDGIPMALGEFLMTVADHVNGYSKEDREELKKLKKLWNLE